MSAQRRHLARRIEANRRTATASPLANDSPVGRGISFVKVTGGSVADGWSCVALDANGAETSQTWTRIRTIPGGSELTADLIYPARIDELSRRPIILG